MSTAELRAGGVTEEERQRILAEVARGGAKLSGLVLTRNRRVMASVGGRGRVLRLHETFLGAPPEVLRALGTLLNGPGRSRIEARALVRAFVREQAPAAPTSRLRRRHVSPSDRAHLERLQAEYDRVNRAHFGGGLPAVPLFLSGRMTRRNGHFSANPLEIVISRRLCESAVNGEAEMTLRHEMIHLWQHSQGLKPGHGADFRRWARRLNVHARATRPVVWR